MQEWFKNHKLATGLISAGVIIVMIIIGVSYSFNVKNDGQRQEQDLAALYKESLNSLSTCIDQGRTAAKVTVQEYETIKQTLVQVASARYVGADGKPTDASSVLGGGQLISALQENYPKVDQRDWQNLQTLVVGCRTDFRDSQNHIQVMAATYNKWRVTDDMFNAWIKAGFPSNELHIVTPNGDTLYGLSAYTRITRVVSTADANAAFNSGQLAQQDLFGK